MKFSVVQIFLIRLKSSAVSKVKISWVCLRAEMEAGFVGWFVGSIEQKLLNITLQGCSKT